MAKFIFYKCPECEGVFKYLHVLSDAPPPDRCELCHAWMSDTEPPQEVFVPQSPGIRKNAYARSMDQTYRAMEEQSIGRAEEAASILEDSYRAQPRDADFESGLLDQTQREQVAQVRSELKITNMRDPSETRPGDISAIPKIANPSSPVTQGSGFQLMGGAPPNHAPGVGGSRSGASAHATISGHQGWVDGSPPVQNPQHRARAQAMSRAGNIGAYSGRK